MWPHGLSSRILARHRSPFRCSFLAVLLAVATTALCPAASRASVVACGQWDELVPTGTPLATLGRGLIYDSSRDRIVAFGVLDSSSLVTPRVVAMSMTGTSTWTDLTTTGTAPSGCSHAIYDATRDRMIVINSCNNAIMDLWALSFTTNSWSQLVVAGTPPSERCGEFAIYDAGRDRIVLGGGTATGVGGMLNDAWVINLTGTPTWTALAPTGTPPVGRYDAAAIYDAPRNRMVMFGGQLEDGTFVNDAWALTLTGGTSWAKLNPSGTLPGGRVYTASIFDSPRNRMVICGGVTSGADVNDVWALSLSGSVAWTRLSPSGPALPNASSHGGVYDSVHQRLVCTGGSGPLTAEVWGMTLSGTVAWSQFLGPARPLPRDNPVFVKDDARARAILFGGSGFSDLWTLSLGATPAWSRVLTAAAAPSLTEATAVVDSLNNRLIVFGGTNGYHDQNGTWALSLTGTPNWTKLSPTGTPPGPRRAAVAIYDRARNRIVVSCGADSVGGQYADTWALSLAGAGAWSELAPDGPDVPFGRRFSAVYDAPRDRMLMVRGYDNYSNLTAGFWQLSFAGGGTWTRMNVGTLPYAQSPWMVLDAAQARVFGSGNVVFDLVSGSDWDLVGEARPNEFANDDYVSAIYDGANARVVTFGGTNQQTARLNGAVRALTFPAGLHSLNVGLHPASGAGGYASADSTWSCFQTGTVVTLTATPAQGFSLAGWSGSASGTANPLVLTMDTDNSVTATLSQPPPVADSWRRVVLDDGALPGMYDGGLIAYDSQRNRLLAIGAYFPPGASASPGFGVWQLLPAAGLADWELISVLSADSLGVRNSMSAAYDPFQDRLLLYGGRINTILDDVWALNFGSMTWTHIAPPSGTGPHLGAHALFDPVRNRLVLYGGQDDLDHPTNDVWVLTLSGTHAWAHVAVAGLRPPALIQQTFVYDSRRDHYLLFGGGSTPDQPVSRDLWSMSFNDSLTGYWTRISMDGAEPAYTAGCGAIYDPLRDRMIVFGGAPTVDGNWLNAHPPSDSVHVLSFKYPYEPRWSRITPDGTLPGPRLGSQTFYDAVDDALVFSSGYRGSFGGGALTGPPETYDGLATADQTFALALGGKYWLDAAPNAPPLGSIARSPAGDAYSPNTVVQLTAVPVPGAAFMGWSGDATGTTNPLSVAMDGDKSILAVFRGITAVTPTALTFVTELAPPAPNPGLAPMRLSFSLARGGNARLSVFDVAGREVAEVARGAFAAGPHSLAWSGASSSGKLGPGLYFVRLVTANRSVTRRFVLLK